MVNVKRANSRCPGHDLGRRIHDVSLGSTEYEIGDQYLALASAESNRACSGNG